MNTVMLEIPKASDSDMVRFESRVIRTDGCWHWTGPLHNGYGSFSFGRENYRAHRVSYELFVGRIPQGLVIDHLCRNRACVNPAHMDLVTVAENIKRGIGPPQKRYTHCRKGHPLGGDNLRLERGTGRGPGRRCLECERIRSIARFDAGRKKPYVRRPRKVPGE